MTVFLAGKISGDDNYKAKFAQAEADLRAQGHAVLSPAVLPSVGFEWEDYLHITTAMIDVCEAVCFLPDWQDSRGAIKEMSYAVFQGKKIEYYCHKEKADEKRG